MHELNRATAIQLIPADVITRRRFQYIAKRGADVVAASLLILLTLPVMLLAIVLIKATSRGPVFYRQLRLKQHGKPFVFFKFRTMIDGADRMMANVIHLNSAHGPFFKATNDPRITTVGRLLRRSFIDELPQLINVLLGDMSLVGPRPCLPDEAKKMGPEASIRFAVPQGLTGPWQVSGYHSMTFEQQLRAEREYVIRWSLVTDVSILARTLPLVMLRKGR